MSQWKQLVEAVPEQNINQIYTNAFPLEVRHFCSEWIEEQRWQDVDPRYPDYEKRAASLRDQLVAVLRNKAEEMTTNDLFLTKLKLKEAATKFEECYQQNPMSLIGVIRGNLQRESTMLHGIGNTEPDTPQAKFARHFEEEFKNLGHQTQQTDRSVNNMQQKQESFVIQYQNSTRINGQLQQFNANPNTIHNQQATIQQLQKQRQEIERELQQQAQELLKLRLELADKQSDTINRLSQLQAHVMDQKVIGWKREQQLAGNGEMFENNLDELQYWCMRLADLIWSNRRQLKKFELLRQQLPISIPTDRQDLVPELNKSVTGLLSGLVTNTFIIEKQPPQVLKKDSRFQATVRLLVGSKFNVHLNPPTVKASIISEEQARSLLTNDRNVRSDASCGNILNSMATMEFNQSSDQLSVTFRNMALKSIKRAEKRGNETVTEEKFCILFQSQFTAGDGELVFQVWTLSVPVVVTVHGNQECNALATVLWDNAFAAQGRAPFQVPDKVPWPQLAHVLHTKFLSQCHRGLSEDNLKYLASKLFGPMDDYSHQVVSWTQFNREALSHRNFTFWEWFYALLKLTKDWLQGPWKEGHIIGFISKEKSHENLNNCPAGTFLLRFSDSESGGVTIAWTHEKLGERQVLNLAPFTDKDFKIRLLADHVKDLHQLTTLYPNIPKSTAFGHLWTQTPPESDKMKLSGYVSREINTVIPLMNHQNISDDVQPMVEDNPNTPIQPYSPVSSISVQHNNMDDFQFPGINADDLVVTDISGTAMDELLDGNFQQL